MKQGNHYLMTSLFAAALGFVSIAANANGNIYSGLGVGLASPSNSGLERAHAWNVFAGNEVNENLAFEVGYTSFGSMGNSVNIKAYEGSSVAILPIGDEWKVFVKAGAISWSIDNADGADIFYGIGAEYAFFDKMSVRASWNSYTLDNSDFDINVDLFTMNLLYRF